jgi:protocatechuate 3,4-dioxygenase beta subunit
LLLSALALCVLSIGATEQNAHERFLGSCQGCEQMFVGMPTTLAWSTRLVPANEPGEPMQIDGVVRDSSGHPAKGIIVYAYHTNSKGLYPPNPKYPDLHHGGLRGWAKTGADGRYHFDTIRPAGYPDADGIPAHVHMSVIEPGRVSYYIDEIVFDDDPRLTEKTRHEVSNGRGGPAITHPTRDAKGVWHVTRDIVLGENIPDYPK